jgi:hypothetical protein
VNRLRDRVLFETIYVCGARAGEVCGLYREDLDLRLDDEHVRIHGKGGTVRTVLLDDRGYVALLKLYLQRTEYKAGPLFRASINGSGGPLSYDAAQHRWTRYCAAAGADIDIHQLRHAHATELINAGVSIEAAPGGSGTPPPRPPSSTPCSTTTSPTTKSAPPDAAPGPRARRHRAGRASAIKTPTLRLAVAFCYGCSSAAMGRSISLTLPFLVSSPSEGRTMAGMGSRARGDPAAGASGDEQLIGAPVLKPINITSPPFPNRAVTACHCRSAPPRAPRTDAGPERTQGTRLGRSPGRSPRGHAIPGVAVDAGDDLGLGPSARKIEIYFSIVRCKVVTRTTSTTWPTPRPE